jgi:thiosulfate/3-mercaptopyruvate sulfurtransferase
MGSNKSHIVSVAWLHENLDIDKLIVLDATIRKVSDFASFSSERWIPKTLYFDLKGKFSAIEAEFPTTMPSQEQFQREARALGVNKDSIIVVYDNKGIYSSARVWWLFRTFGFESVSVLDGGLPEWKKMNYKTVSSLDSPSLGVGNFSAVYQPKNMCFFDDISKVFKNEYHIILDARSTERFQSRVPEPRVGLRRGTIPNSENLPYSNLLNGNCLKSKEDLKSIFNSFNLEDKSLTFTCGSGITACILALAAYILDYKKITVYDGSWTEYGTLIT